MQNSAANSSRASITSDSTAPQARARSRMTSMSSPSCPTSTATAITSAPVRSARYGIATDVSSPPEYARTTQSPIFVPSPCVLVCPTAVRLVDVRAGGPARDLRGELLAGRTAGWFLFGDDHDGVVAGNGADHVRQPRAI